MDINVAMEREASRERQRERRLEAAARMVLLDLGAFPSARDVAEASSRWGPDRWRVARRALELSRNGDGHRRIPVPAAPAPPAPAPTPHPYYAGIKSLTCVHCGRETSTYHMNQYRECEACAPLHPEYSIDWTLTTEVPAS